jgi:anti-anti-sigma factor
VPVNFSIADSSDGPRRVVIWVTGDLDAETARAVRTRLAQAERHGRSDVVLDMTSVTTIDPEALTTIATGVRALGDDDRLRVISPPNGMAEMLSESGIQSTLEVVANRRATDRRRSSIPVEFDRRKGGDRRHPVTDGA